MYRRNTTSRRGRLTACILATAALTLCLAAGVNASTLFTSHSSDLRNSATHRTDLPTPGTVLASDRDDYVELLVAAGIADFPTAR